MDCGKLVATAVSIIIIMLAGMIAGVLLHEVGHYAACRYLGHVSGGITITLTESSHMCKFGGTVHSAEVLIVRAAGGGMAALVFGVLFAIFAFTVARKVTRLNNYVRPFLLAGFIPQVINLVMEAGFTAWYNDTTRMVGMAAGVTCVVWLERRQFPKRRSRGRPSR